MIGTRPGIYGLVLAAHLTILKHLFPASIRSQITSGILTNMVIAKIIKSSIPEARRMKKKNQKIIEQTRSHHRACVSAA